MPERDLLVRIIGDDRSLQQAFTRSSRGAQQFESRTSKIGSNVGRAFAAAGVTLGAAAAATAIRAMIQDASDLSEEISKSEQVFGDSSRAIQEWSDTTAQAIGVAKVQALSATGTFGNLFRTVEVGPEAAASMSQALVKLAADLASFNNANIDDVLLAIRSGLIGEAEPLRRYGVLLSEARVQGVALAATGKTNVKALSDQEKATARYNIILQDTATAQGDFARTSDGLANQSRILRAQLSDMSAELGANLLPALLKVVGAANAAFDAFDRLGSIGGKTITIDPKVNLDNLRATRNEIAAIRGETDLLVVALDKAIARITQFRASKTPPSTGARDAGGAGALDLESQISAAAVARDRAAAARAKAELEASRKRFADFTKGLGLKLKSAGLSDDLGDDIAVLREIERAILRQIEREGRTFVLADQLADIRSQIARTVATRSENAAAAARTAFEDIVAALNLGLDRASQTPGAGDDLAALRRIERAILERIEEEGRTVELLGDLQQTRAEMVEKSQELRRQRQFTALGLTLEGDERVPGIGALRRRGRNLLESIEGTELDTAKNRNRIGAIFTSQFKVAGRQVRQAILDFFNEIDTALSQGSNRSQGRQTKFRVVNTSQILGGLGLSEEEQQRLRRRLSRLGPGGTTPRDGGPGGAFGFDVGSGGNTIITGPVTVVSNDPDDMGRQLQKRSRRTARARTGGRGGDNL